MTLTEDQNQNPPKETEWVKQRISDEEITKLQKRLENLVKLLHQRDVIIRKQSQLLEAYGINMMVLARNSTGILDASVEDMV